MEQSLPIKWKRYAKNPLTSLAPQPGSWRADATMTIDILVDKDQYVGYYNGKVGGTNSLGIATCPKADFNGLNWTDYPENPILGPGEPGSFDSRHVIDPATVRFQNSTFLYYSALGDGVDSIGLATSDDGIHFQKHSQPVLVGRSPEVFLRDKTLFLFYILKNKQDGYIFHLATSTDGISFKEEGPIFLPGSSGWDSFSILTARIFYEGGIYILSYAGDDHEVDRPKHFGIAFSTDMRTWVKYSQNPIFEVGSPDSWEGKGIWFPEIVHHGDTFYMLYEGNDGKRSQIGLAMSSDPIIEIGRRALGLD